VSKARRCHISRTFSAIETVFVEAQLQATFKREASQQYANGFCDKGGNSFHGVWSEIGQGFSPIVAVHALLGGLTLELSGGAAVRLNEMLDDCGEVRLGEAVGQDKRRTPSNRPLQTTSSAGA